MSAPVLRSMTGYAQARVEQNGWAVELNLRSVNHRFLDVRVHIPEGWDALEAEIRQMARREVHRGHLDVTVQVDAAQGAAIAVNRDVAAAYLRAAKSLAEQFGLHSDPDIAAILRLPGVTVSAQPGEEDRRKLGAMVGEGMKQALERLNQMRQEEGRAMKAELSRRLASLGESVERIEGLSPRARAAFAGRLEARVNELLGNFRLDPARLAQEVAFAAERSDIREELARLASHVRQFRGLLDSGGEVGKKLDFLSQEMQREANTLLAKTGGIESEGLEITHLGLEAKAEIERLREQVQNIE